VLRDNYLQGEAISMPSAQGVPMCSTSRSRADARPRAARGQLSRSIEFPADDETLGYAPLRESA